ncbi:MAG: F0F1 ATP synthase subunit delta [Pseudomonadota bacterium]
MAEIVTIARPYAEAVFRLAKQRNQLAAWSDMLALAAAVVADERVAARVVDPNVTGAQAEALFLGICGDKLDDAGKNMIKVLVQNDRLTLLPQIAQLYNELRAQAEGVLDANITSAFPLNDDQVKQLVGKLEAKYKRKINPQVQVDKALIGGVKIEIGDEVLDASVRGKLQEMAFALTR